MSNRRSGLGTWLGAALCLVMAGALGASASGCGQNSCDRAAQHEIDCDVVTVSTTTSSSSGAGIPTDCSGVSECEGTCLASAPCEELQSYNVPGKATKLKDCFAKCLNPINEGTEATESVASPGFATRPQQSQARSD